LSALEEKGSYDDAWFPPQNKFDWSAVDRLEIVSENQDLTGVDFWFDDIRISGEDIDPVLAVIEHAAPAIFSVYPNPVTKDSFVSFSVSDPGYVQIDVLSVTGQKVASVTNQIFQTGQYRLSLAN